MRYTEITRKTGETDIVLSLQIDGKGDADVKSGCGFLDHMLTLFAKHGKMDLTVNARGDTWVDYHHTVEDVGIALGQAFCTALGDKKGVTRYGDTYLPMDEALILTAADLSGRGILVYAADIPTEKVGDFDTELCEEFWTAFAREAGVSLHIRQICGSNSHHIIEGIFKSCARTLRKACEIDAKFAEEIPSTKGVLA